jgi:creatinine amidohydrolase
LNLRSSCVAALIFCLNFVTVQAASGIYLEEMTWTELRDAVAAGHTTAIIPIGGTEQSGPHMALGKHNARVKVIAGLIAEKLGDAIVAPVIAYVPEGAIDPPTEHMKFPGTLTVSDDAFMQVLESAAASLKHAGFKRVVFIGDHGGYQRDLAVVADKLNAKWKSSDARVLADLDYYRLSQEPYAKALDAQGIRRDEIGSHAALADTSLELATVPDMVRTDTMKNTNLMIAGQGVYGGNPARSSAELGQLGIDLIVSGTVTAIRKFEASK